MFAENIGRSFRTVSLIGAVGLTACKSEKPVTQRFLSDYTTPSVPAAQSAVTAYKPLPAAMPVANENSGKAKPLKVKLGSITYNPSTLCDRSWDPSWEPQRANGFLKNAPIYPGQVNLTIRQLPARTNLIKITGEIRCKEQEIPALPNMTFQKCCIIESKSPIRFTVETVTFDEPSDYMCSTTGNIVANSRAAGYSTGKIELVVRGDYPTKVRK